MRAIESYCGGLVIRVWYHLRKLSRCGLDERTVSLRVSFEVSKAQACCHALTKMILDQTSVNQKPA